MFKLISIDPGKCKCGLVLVDLPKKKVDQAIVLNTEFLPNYVKNLKGSENISKVIIGNGTTSRQNIEKLDFKKTYEFENSNDYLLEILKDDKKSKSDSVDIVLLSGISQPNLISISFDELIEVIQN